MGRRFRLGIWEGEGALVCGEEGGGVCLIGQR